MTKTTYTAELTSVGNSKIQVIKAYRELTCVGLKEAMDKVESAPCIVLETTNRKEAECYRTALEKCGAIVNVYGSTEEVTSPEIGRKKITGAEFIKAIALAFVGCCCAIGIAAVICFLIR